MADIITEVVTAEVFNQQNAELAEKVYWKPDDWKLPTDLPSTYPVLQTTQFYTTNSEWKTSLNSNDIFGIVIKTEMRSNYYILQSVFASNSNPLMYRLAEGSNKWGPWRTHATVEQLNALVEKTEIVFPFAAGYSKVDGYKSGIIKMLNRVCVYVACSPNSGDFSSGATIATLPVGYRPSSRVCGLLRDITNSTTASIPYLLGSDGNLSLRQGEYASNQIAGVIVYDI